MRCKVCSSPHRSLIEKWYAERMSIRQISKKLREEYGEKISTWPIWRHFKEGHHLQAETHLRMLKKDIASYKQDDAVHIVGEIEKNLGILRELVNKIVRREDILEDEKLITALKGLLSEIRLTIKALAELKEKMKTDNLPTREELVNYVIYLLKDEDREVIERVKMKAFKVMENA